MWEIVEKLKTQNKRKSTSATYLRVWRQFNNFIIQLDDMPITWEERTVLFIGHLVHKGVQSSSVKSYVSAIKSTLLDDGYQWEDNKVLINSLTRACKLKNDKIQTRLPIQCNLLELLLFEVHRHFNGEQPYLTSLYRALFALGYYGLFRVGELTMSDHVIKAKNVHMGSNKPKLLIVLYSSKTHSIASRPQKVKIVANNKEKTGSYMDRYFCPFRLIREYLAIRGGFVSDTEPLFVFRDKSPVSPNNARDLLRSLLISIGLNPTWYGMHSLRIGRSTDLVRFGYSLDEVRRFGRWRSNTVYKYIR